MQPASTIITPCVTATTSAERLERWLWLERSWRFKIQKVNAYEAVEVSSLDELKTVLAISPALDHLKSFANAITSASQAQPVACLVWGGIQAVIESANAYHRLDEDVIDIIVELNEALPHFEQYERHFSQSIAMQFVLQDLFEDFMSYCSQASAYFRRPTHVNIVLNLVWSNPQRLLQTTKTQIKRHVRILRQAAADAAKKESEQTDSGVTSPMPSSLTARPQKISTFGSGAKVIFPVYEITKSANRAFIGRADNFKEAYKILNNIRRARYSTFSTFDADENVSDDETVLVENTGTQPDRPPATASAGSTVVEPSDTNTDSQRMEQAPNSDGNSLLHNPTGLYIPATCVIHGLAGVGKTQIALQYYFNYRQEYDAVFWLEAEHDWTLQKSFARIADRLGLLSMQTKEVNGDQMMARAIEESRQWLQRTNRKWLLIFDNVEDVIDLDQYLPTECNSQSGILITTQKPIISPWVDNVGYIAVKELNRKEAAQCIFKYLGRDPRDKEEDFVARELADHVGRLPLAMATIGGYLQQSKIELSEFYESIKHDASLWEEAPRVTVPQAYGRSLESVFDKVFSALDEPSHSLLNILAFLDPDDVPEEYFIKGIQAKLLPMFTNVHQLKSCYFNLRARQLIDRNTVSSETNITIHRLVQWNVILKLSRDYRHRWKVFKQAFALVRNMLPRPSPLVIPEPDMWPPYAKYGRQVLELRLHCLWPEPPVELPMDFARILSDMGTYMWYSGKFPQGQDALKTAEHILDDNHTKFTHLLRSNIWEVLGIISSSQGVSQREESMEFRKAALKSREKHFEDIPPVKRTREEEIMLWNVRSDMAYGWIQEENFGEVERIMKQCYEQYQKWERNEKAIAFEYTKYYQLMAFYHMAVQTPVKAMETIARGHELMLVAAGNEHPFSQVIKFCWANLLWHADPNQRNACLQINEVVLEHRKKTLGEFSHFTLESYSTCGKLCADLGKYETAAKYLETCLQRRKRTIWNEEGVARALFRSVPVLKKLAETERAKPDGNLRKAEQYERNAALRQSTVDVTVERFASKYRQYLLETDDQEAILDQMVSIWSGRYTGKLAQSKHEVLPQQQVPVRSHACGVWRAD